MSITRQIVIVGFGNMGRALAKGLQRKGNLKLFISDKFPAPNETDLNAAGIKHSMVTWLKPQDKAVTLKGEVVFVLATKPQNLEAVVEEWRSRISQPDVQPIVISILAGVTTQALEELLPPGIPVVRAMPNIAATVDHAATVICAGAQATEAHLKIAQEVFDAVGKTWVAQEDHLNAVTGLSGSGPAYIYMVIEALSDGGVKMGLPRQLALDLATQTVIGAGILVQETKLHPAVLRDQVTTPGGTTISAIHELERHGLRAMLIQAVVTATKRSALLLKKTKKQ